MKHLIFWIALGVVSLNAQELQNGDFVHGLKKWQVAAPKLSDVTKEITEDGPDGRTALKIVIGNVGPIDNVVSLNQGGLLMDEGLTYTLSFWAKCEPGPAKITVSVSFLGSGLQYPARPKKIDLNSAWTRYTYTFKPGMTGEKSMLSFNNMGLNNTTFYFADIQLSQVSPQ
jgi:hypothetical protein